MQKKKNSLKPRKIIPMAMTDEDSNSILNSFLLNEADGNRNRV